MFAIIAAVLFGLALLFKLIGVGVAILSPAVLVLAGLLCVGLHLAGVGGAGGAGGRVWVRGHTRRQG